jgi:hypothetical protein
MAEQRAVANRECSSKEFGDVLLVSGPSGAGKSTFIELLATGGLPDCVSSLLPDVLDWPVIEANDCLKRGMTVGEVRALASNAAGLILHYDTAFIFRHGLRDYHEDPVFEILREAKRLVAVSLRPSPEVLRAQFESRRRLQIKKKGWLRQAWRISIHAPLRHLRHMLSGITTIDTAELYRESSHIDRCYREWDTFSKSLIHSKPNSRLLHVVPQESSGTRRSYALIGLLERTEQDLPQGPSSFPWAHRQLRSPTSERLSLNTGSVEACSANNA